MSRPRVARMRFSSAVTGKGMTRDGGDEVIYLARPDIHAASDSRNFD